jgi:hypothetical protein
MWSSCSRLLPANVRDPMKGAKGAARTANSRKKPIAPHSVLRKFLKRLVLVLVAAGLALPQTQTPPAARNAETPKPEPARTAGKWELQFFHDKDDSTFQIFDLKFPSAQRGVAVGEIAGKGKPKPAALVTSNGGAKWDYVDLKESPRSLFFLDETHGWMVTEKGIWTTQEAGRNWTKLAALKNIVRVHFTSPARGWAVGALKSVYETSDGGKRWTKLEAAATPPGNPEYTAYRSIAFANAKAGIIAGASRPPRRAESPLPDWMEPESQRFRRQWPALTILLQTVDGGEHWRADSMSMFGTVTHLSLAEDRRGLALIEFFDSFDFPSEVHLLDLATGANAIAFRRKDRAVTDVALLPRGPAYLAAIEPSGSMPHSPVPGKLKMLRSDDMQLWQEMDVDYRATATRAILATAGPERAWVATDTGMILRLTR